MEFFSDLLGIKRNVYSIMAYLLLFLLVLRRRHEDVGRWQDAAADALCRMMALNGIWLLIGLAVQESMAGIWLYVGEGLTLTMAEAMLLIVWHVLLQKKESETGSRCTLLEQRETCSDDSSLEKPLLYPEQLTDIRIRGSYQRKKADKPMLYWSGLGFGSLQALIKRILDILISVMLLILLSPVYLLLAICIRIQDGGPVFYCQRRCTKDMKEFGIYKFRSMRIDAEEAEGPKFAEEDDDRLTGIGRLIRNTKLDELPQLWNILKGDMSLVGPRPERPEFIAEITRELPEFELRTRVKAGLTGYAQVMGGYHMAFADKLCWDLIYIRNQSLFLDIKIMVLTVLLILFPTKE